jgi:hypothetical protein
VGWFGPEEAMTSTTGIWCWACRSDDHTADGCAVATTRRQAQTRAATLASAAARAEKTGQEERKERTTESATSARKKATKAGPIVPLGAATNGTAPSETIAATTAALLAPLIERLRQEQHEHQLAAERIGRALAALNRA